ncbi:hypothetical protein MCOR21_003115 [Pyricularia oryzae]|nr:hypothetical protein MCOR21_003115 [Pyricularia oryzae]KAI6522467.1 hypothetical protein MCOR10_005625 [Pyricularia oryzae]
MAETRRPSPAASGKFVTVKALIMLIVPKSVLLSELTPNAFSLLVLSQRLVLQTKRHNLHVDFQRVARQTPWTTTSASSTSGSTVQQRPFLILMTASSSSQLCLDDLSDGPVLRIATLGARIAGSAVTAVEILLCVLRKRFA